MGEGEIVAGGGVDKMGFGSSIEGGSDGKSDRGTNHRRQWPRQY